MVQKRFKYVVIFIVISDGQKGRMEWWAEERLEAEMGRPQGSFLANSCLTHQPSSKVFLDVEVIMCILFNLQLFCQVG